MLPMVTALLIALAVMLSFYRFYVTQDYLIAFQAPCDTTLHSCFVGECEDGDASCEVSYYAVLTKRAADFARDCGSDIENCEKAAACLATDSFCTIEYCTTENELDAVCAGSTE